MAVEPVPIHEKPLLSVREAAALTGLPRDYLNCVTRTGELPTLRTSRTGFRHIRRADLDTWLERAAQRGV